MLIDTHLFKVLQERRQQRGEIKNAGEGGNYCETKSVLTLKDKEGMLSQAWTSYI